MPKAYIIYSDPHISDLLQSADVYPKSKVFVNVIKTSTNMDKSSFEISTKLLVSIFGKTDSKLVFFGVEGVGGWAVPDINAVGIFQQRLGWLTLADMVSQLGFEVTTDEDMFLTSITPKGGGYAAQVLS